MVQIRELQLSDLDQVKVKQASLTSDTVLIKEDQREIARLVPSETLPKYKRELGTYDGVIKVGEEIFDPLPDDELDAMGL